jgi:hypothetical protein
MIRDAESRHLRLFIVLVIVGLQPAIPKVAVPNEQFPKAVIPSMGGELTGVFYRLSLLMAI